MRSSCGAGSAGQDNRTLQESASIDFLTQLLNRRSAELHLRREIARARRNRAPLGFIMIDLDCFKRVNDGHGHQAGDAVLVHVGRILRSRARESDVVVRYGGDEFLVVTPDTDLAGTAKLAEALRTLIQEKPANYDGRELPVQASLGVAGAGPGQHVSAEELLARADKALYAAKERGRNQVVTWEDSAGSLPEAVPAARSAAVAQ
ncbi:MAG: GGDEF domain-containing protein [Planctomycetota bacterium]|nr:GGDEF domain-containing protein [Planctomycetota bacterium]